MVSNPSTLPELLERAAANRPGSSIGVVGGASIPLATLVARAASAARALVWRGALPGRPVLLVVHEIDDFLVAFWAALFAGAVPAPVAGPRDVSDPERARLLRQAQILGDPLVVVDRALAPLWPDAVDVGALLVAAETAAPLRAGRPGPALVQFSSGSTRDPTGVTLTHENVLANVTQLAQALPLSPDDHVLSWMPHFHDMGLIGAHLVPLAVGCFQTRMDPVAAMVDPLTWLEAAAEARATCLPSTPFALARAVRALERDATQGGLRRPDLARVRLVMTGAEPIDPAVLRAFSRAFGLSDDVHLPLYGLAEASVGVCAPRRPGVQVRQVDGRARVVVGPPLPGMHLRIVDELGRALPEGAVGEIEVDGPNVTRGYWAAPAATSALFRDGWLRTGDRGALQEGELVVVGRSKEVLFANGRTLHAHDLELLVEEVEGVRPGSAVVLADPRRSDEAVAAMLVLDTDAPAPHVLREVRRRLRGETGLDVDAMAMPHVPRTTSGKKRRGLLRDELSRGAFDGLGHRATEDAVQALWSDVLGRALDESDRAVTFRNLGGTSVQAVQIVARVAAHFGVTPSHRLLLEGSSVIEMARLLLRADLDEGVAATVQSTRPPAAAMREAPEPIAIVGLSLRVPGARGPASLWALAAEGRALLGPPPADRLPLGRTTGEAPIGGWLSADEVERFDADRFRIADSEAAVMDPQQRLLLDLIDDLLARAPLGTRQVGVFVGAGQVANLEGLMSVADRDASALPPGALAGNLLNVLAARAAHVLNLNGPALTIDSACSASLVALHLAVQALRAHDCEAAVVAGVHLNLTSRIFELFDRAGARSPSGRCAPFTGEADGTVPGEGAVALSLVPLTLADARGLPVLGLVRGTAINNDGTTLGIMAPSPAGQEEVLRRALRQAGVDAGRVARVEGHGSATRVGDDVERSVLARVYPHEPTLDSVKRNLGHLMGAAGAIGLARLLGALAPGELGGVSSFGFGGTNAHAIIEGARTRVVDAHLAELPPRGRRFPILRPALPPTGAAPAADAAPSTAAAAGPAAHEARLPAFVVEAGTPAVLTSTTLGADATRLRGHYLITGALGGLGRALCRRLARRQARLLLLGRRAPSDAGDFLRELTELGADARYSSLDLATPGAGRALALAVAAHPGRLDGIFHLAGGLAPGELRGKREGALRLEALDAGFTIYASSVAACLPGMAAGLQEYASANAALDDAARAAWGRGDPSVRSVALGPIDDAGLASGLGARQHFAKLGLSTLSADEAAEALARSPSVDAPHLAVFRRSAAVMARPFSRAALGATRLFDEALRLVAEAVGKPAASLDRDAPFAALGLDSIVAIDLVKELEQLAGRELSSTLLFEHDTLARLEVALAKLPGDPAPPVAAPPIAPEELELLPAQRTWVVQRRFFPEMPGNVYLAATVVAPTEAPVTVPELERVLDVLVARHPSLAACIARRGDRWCQIAGPRPRVLGVAVLDAASEDALADEVFDLERGPLVRVYTDGHRLAVNAHHSVLDAWSARLVFEELLAGLAAMRQGARLELPGLHSTLAEVFAIRRRAGDLKALEELRARVRGAPPLPLPSLVDADAPVAGGAALLKRVLSVAQSAKLTEQARRAGASVPSTVLAAFLHGLFDATGQHDLLVRLAHGGRDVRLPGAERLVGAFADSLPLRTRIELDDTLDTLARRVHEEIGFLLARASVSAAQLGGAHDEASGPVGVSPIAFSFPPVAGAAAPTGFVLDDVTGRAAAGATRLTLVAFIVQDRLHLCFNYARSHLSRAFVEEMADRVEQLLREGVEPLPATLHGAIVRRAALHPERRAVQDLSYGALVRRSAALATRLAETHGACPGARVAVLAAPSADAVVALLGVLRTGAAYVPLDPAWPDLRIRQVLEAARCAALVVPQGQACRARALATTPLTLIDDEEADSGPCVESGADGAPLVAYVMFTSGSSGAPKGVVVGHRACLAFQRWVMRAFRVTAEDRFAQTSSLGFGGSVRQIFSPLLSGGSIHPVASEVLRDPDLLVRFLADERVTVWNSVPSLFTHLLDAAERTELPAPFEHMRAILIGGEPVPAAVVRRWRALAPRLCGPRRSCRWFNLYGSVETLVNATWFEVVRDPPPNAVHTPIGWPRAFTDVCLIDESAEGIGEIAVSGALADGYLDGSANNEIAFRSHLGRRTYHTGDLARRLPDGSLVHLGRRDGQVQVRGNRVETVEIEMTLAAHPEVRAAAVVFVDGWLRAAVELREGADAAAAPAALRAFLDARLPAYMVPNHFEVVSALPRNPAGKADKLTMSAPAADRERGEHAERAEHALLRRSLADAWSTVLRLAAPPTDDDDFYALGGDSLRALEVLDHLRAALGPRAGALRPLALHRHRRFGALLEALIASGRADSRPVDVIAGRTEAPGSAVQRGFLWAQEKAGRAPTFCAAIPLEGALDRQAMVAALRFVVERHAALRVAFAREDRGARAGAWRQAAHPVDPTLSFEDLRGLDDAQQRARRRQRFDEAAALDFDPRRAPLWSARLLALGPPDAEHHELVLSAHHAILDAWSAFLLVAELCEAHDAFRAGRAPALPPLPRSFLDVAAGERDLPTDEERAHWAGMLEGLDQQAAPTEAERSLVVALPASVKEALVERARAQAVSPFSLFFGLVARVVAELEGTDDLAISVAADGRGTTRGEDGGIVGPFARGVPVRLREARSAGVLEVDRALGAALAHADAPPAAIAAALGGDALDRLSRHFVSWLDPSGVARTEGTVGDALAPRWDEAQVRFAASSTRTALMVGALLGARGLAVHLHGGALVDRAAPLLESRMRALAAADSALVIYPPANVPLLAPVVCERVTSSLGVSDVVLLPIAAAALPATVDLEARVASALALSDAPVAALGGVLPALLGLGLRGAPGPKLVTTGHAATVVAMAWTVEAALAAVGARISQAQVAVVGYGSIGRASLALCRALLGDPASVRIVDPRVADSATDVIGCDLVLGATSGGPTLDVARLSPGTIVVDDSFPRAFDDRAAWARMRERRDVLLVGGGMLDAGVLVRRSPFAEAAALYAELPVRWLPGCHAEAMLLAKRRALGATVGPVSVERARTVADALRAEGVRAAPLHLGKDLIGDDVLDGVRRARSKLSS